MNHNIIIGAIAVVLIIAVLYFVEESRPGEYDAFAQCLSDANATFYGAYWCGHCKEQKDVFGKSFKYLNSVECSLPNNAGQTQECTDAGIRGYPTWKFADGSEHLGPASFDVLSAKTGCVFVE